MPTLSLLPTLVTEAFLGVSVRPYVESNIYTSDKSTAYNTLATILREPNNGLFYYLFLLISGAAIVYIVWGGINYIQAGSDPKKATDARTAIINGVIGLTIAISAFLLVSIGAGLGNAVNGLRTDSIEFKTGTTSSTTTGTTKNVQCLNSATNSACLPIANKCNIVNPATNKVTNTACKEGSICHCSATDVGCGTGNPCQPASVIPECVCSDKKTQSCSTNSDCTSN